jgi:Protein of unknown function (DUF3043)
MRPLRSGLCARPHSVYASLVFRRRSDDQAAADTATASTTTGTATRPDSALDRGFDRSKKAPTPSRREAEAARKARLGALPTDPKERRRAERAARNEAMQRQRQAVRSGDVKNYPARDQGEARAFVRDYVDGRLRLLEFLMPIVVVAWLTIVLHSTAIYIYASFVMELVVVLGIVLGVLLNVRVKRAVREKFGDEHAHGTGFYAFSRAAMPRFLRQPRPTMNFRGQQK